MQKSQYKPAVGKARYLRHNATCALLLALALVCAACSSQPTTTTPGSTPGATRAVTPTKTSPPQATPTATSTISRYTAHILLQDNNVSPDDLAFDNQGRMLFSDVAHGTINQLNSNHTITVLQRGLGEPEGIVVLNSGEMLVSEQSTNRLLSIKPDASAPSVIRVLPGTTASSGCKAGIDSIALDPTTQTIIVPDSPTGVVYRMSLDGHQLTPLASGLSRPVGAAVDHKGNIYIADECGGAIWKITPSGQKTRLGGFGMPDDVAFDPQGNLLVIDLKGAVHSLIRVNLATGRHDILASNRLIEPQGLLVGKNGHIFVSDDNANLIMEYTPV